MNDNVKFKMEKKTSLFTLLCDLSYEQAAEKVLNLMHQENVSILNLSDDSQPNDTLSDPVCQHIAEKGLKEILDIVKSIPIQKKHLFAGSVLVAIKDLHVVKKYIWKDKDLISTLERFMTFPCQNTTTDFILLRDIVAHLIQGTLLGGTPSMYFEMIGSSEIIKLYVDLIKNQWQVKSNYSYEEFLLTLLLLCQNSKTCLQKCTDLLVPKILTEFSTTIGLDANIKDKAEVASTCIQHMINEKSLPEHRKLLLNKFSGHIHNKNKSCKRMETILCSYAVCSKVQPEDLDKRFKKCGRCKVALYCSKQCQVAHWKSGHSKFCVPPL